MGPQKKKSDSDCHAIDFAPYFYAGELDYKCKEES